MALVASARHKTKLAFLPMITEADKFQIFADAVLSIGSVWGERSGHGKAKGVMAYLELCATGQVCAFIKDGELFFFDPTAKHKGTA